MLELTKTAETVGRAAVDVTGSGSVEFLDAFEAVTLRAAFEHDENPYTPISRAVAHAVEHLRPRFDSPRLAAIYSHYSRMAPARIFDALAADSIAVLLRAGV